MLHISSYGELRVKVSVCAHVCVCAYGCVCACARAHMYKKRWELNKKQA